MCTFITKPNIKGVYGLAWTYAVIHEVIWTLGLNFGSLGALATNSKICTFITKPHNVYGLWTRLYSLDRLYGLAWTPAIIL